MRLLAVDTETTGLDPTADRVVEIGAALCDTDRDVVLVTMSRLIRCDLPPHPVSGILPEDLAEFGVDLADALRELDGLAQRAERLVGHNSVAFDVPFLAAESARAGIEGAAYLSKPWIDTYVDLPVRKAGNLVTMCAEHGFVNPWKHRALFDALSSVRLLTAYQLDDVVKLADAPVITLVAKGLPYDRRHEAKQAGFHWDPQARVWFRKTKRPPRDLSFYVEAV